MDRARRSFGPSRLWMCVRVDGGLIAGMIRAQIDLPPLSLCCVATEDLTYHDVGAAVTGHLLCQGAPWTLRLYMLLAPPVYCFVVAILLT